MTPGEDDDFRFEPVRGLPDRLPPGERLLWQGAPDWRMLARHALGARIVAGYFGLLALWRGAAAGMAGGAWDGLGAALLYLLLGAATLLIIAGAAWVMARTTVYSITTRRIVMRIGAALPVSFNLPYARLEKADLRRHPGGTGDIVLTLREGDRLSYLVTWPHVRPWAISGRNPALRCIPDAAAVSALLGRAACARLSEDRSHDDVPHAVAAE